MKLRQLYDKIVSLSKMSDPNVGDCFYGDVYQLNHIQTVKYPSVVVTNSNHNGSMDDYYFEYRLNIFYIDRLTDNQENKIDIHSAAITFLNTLVKELDEDLIIRNYEINCFNERFNDMCSGAYVTLYLRLPISDCYETNGEIITDLTDINITENGEYTAPYNTAYKHINVDVKTKSFDEYFRKIIEGRLDEPLVIPANTTFIRSNAFEYLNFKGRTTDIVCPLVELPEGNKIVIGGSAFRYARIKKIIVPSDNGLNGTYIFANNTNLEELIWKSNNAAFYMCADCTNLKKVVFTGDNPLISVYAFSNCTNLKLVDLSSCTNVARLSSTNAFTNVPTTCEFRIPASLYDEWINATNWSAIYAQGYKFTAV